MKTLVLTYKGRDRWSRPVYESEGILYMDVNPRKSYKPDICTKYQNEFDGEPNDPIAEDVQVTFLPCRNTWD